jgi:hypothetical protein
MLDLAVTSKALTPTSPGELSSGNGGRHPGMDAYRAPQRSGASVAGEWWTYP